MELSYVNLYLKAVYYSSKFATYLVQNGLFLIRKCRNSQKANIPAEAIPTRAIWERFIQMFSSYQSDIQCILGISNSRNYILLNRDELKTVPEMEIRRFRS